MANPEVVPRVPGHYPKFQDYSSKLLSTELIEEHLHTRLKHALQLGKGHN